MSRATTTKTSLTCAVLTVSNSRTPANDTSGDYLKSSILAAGHQCAAQLISSSNPYQIRKIISDWIFDERIQIIITNGGTGFSHQKSTGAAITPLLDMTLAGFGELFRYLSYLEIGSSTLQSDAFAGAANNTLIFSIPGSANACKTAWERILKEQLNSMHRPCNFATHFKLASHT